MTCRFQNGKRQNRCFCFFKRNVSMLKCLKPVTNNLPSSPGIPYHIKQTRGKLLNPDEQGIQVLFYEEW
jgi:hypothetical protein